MCLWCLPIYFGKSIMLGSYYFQEMTLADEILRHFYNRLAHVWSLSNDVMFCDISSFVTSLV